MGTGILRCPHPQPCSDSGTSVCEHPPDKFSDGKFPVSFSFSFCLNIRAQKPCEAVGGSPSRAQWHTCLRESVGVQGCAGLCKGVQGCARDRVRGGRWPRLEDTHRSSPQLSVGCFSPRLAAPTALKRRRRESLAPLRQRSSFGMSGQRVSSTPLLLLLLLARFPHFPCAGLSGLCTHASPLQLSQSLSALLRLPPARTQMLLGRKVAEVELQETFHSQLHWFGAACLQEERVLTALAASEHCSFGKCCKQAK